MLSCRKAVRDIELAVAHPYATTFWWAAVAEHVATVTVTDHGRPVARIVPDGQPTRLEQLRAEGRVQAARKKKQPAPEPIRGEGMVSELIEEQRR